RLHPGDARRSGHQPVADAPARAGGRRQRVPLGRPAVRLQGRSRLQGPRPVGQWIDARGPLEEVADGFAPLGTTIVLIRFGTSPTGITAITSLACVSIADTERRPALET